MGTHAYQDPIENAIYVIYTILVMNFIICKDNVIKHVYLEYTQQTLIYISLVIYLTTVMFMSYIKFVHLVKVIQQRGQPPS
jgi:protein-S-isoprenylcysteine O-methyltransferase Ste14